MNRKGLKNRDEIEDMCSNNGGGGIMLYIHTSSINGRLATDITTIQLLKSPHILHGSSAIYVTGKFDEQKCW